MNIIIKGNRNDNFGKTRSQQEVNMRKEWGQTMSDEQLDKLKFIEKRVKEHSGSDKNFITCDKIDMVK